MNIEQYSLLRPRMSLGFKRYLLALNRDLDSVKTDIETNRDYGFLFDHSIFPRNHSLSEVELAILFLEDRRFFIHRGIEIRSFARALKRLISRGRVGGISTIDQQVIRISTKRYQRTASRKSKELLLAFFMNFHCSKREMFDFYLHNAYLGYRIQGCEVAAKKLFGSTAIALDQEQAQLIACLFPLPFPSSVWEAYASHPLYPFSNPNDILRLAEEIAPRWAGRISYRMVAAKGYLDFRPKSL